MPKASSSLYAQRRARTIAAILLLGEIMPFPCSYCAKKGLVYIVLASPTARQLFSCSECTKANI